MKYYDPFRGDPRYQKSEYNWQPVADYSPFAQGNGTNGAPFAVLGGALPLLAILALIDFLTGTTMSRDLIVGFFKLLSKIFS